MNPNIIRDKDGNAIEIKISWTADDVRHAAENCTFGDTLTDKEIGYVLENVYSDQSPEYGVNWIDIENAIDDIIKDRSNIEKGA